MDLVSLILTKQTKWNHTQFLLSYKLYVNHSDLCFKMLDKLNGSLLQNTKHISRLVQSCSSFSLSFFYTHLLNTTSCHIWSLIIATHIWHKISIFEICIFYFNLPWDLEWYVSTGKFYKTKKTCWFIKWMTVMEFANEKLCNVRPVNTNSNTFVSFTALSNTCAVRGQVKLVKIKCPQEYLYVLINSGFDLNMS